MSLHKRLGRNDPCWCGSGKNLKKCHNDGARPNPLLPSEIIQHLDHAMSYKKCLHPDTSESTCILPIVKAHTIQRSRVLESIAEKGHVLHFPRRNPNQIWNSILPKPDRIGINNASTFTGFCGKHDDELFKSIEALPINAINARLACLFGFRTICHELYLKYGSKDHFEFMLKNAHRVNVHDDLQTVRDKIRLYLQGIERAITDLTRHKQNYDNAIRNCDHAESYYYCIYLEKNPELLCSGCAQPEYDFKGNLLQSLDDLSIEFEHLTCSFLSAGSSGLILFSWIGIQATSLQFIKSLNDLSNGELPAATFTYAIETFENSFFSPRWWNQLGDQKKAEITKRYYDSLINPIRKSDYLTHPILQAIDWIVVKRDTNLSL